MGIFSAFVLSQIFAGIAFVFDFLSFQQKSKRNIMLMLIVSATFLVVHYFLLEQVLAGLLVSLSLIRFVTCIFTSNKKIMYLFLLLNSIVFFFTYEKVLDFVIFLGVTIIVISNFQEKDKNLRLIMMLGTSFMILFNLLIFSPVGAIVEGNLLLSNLIGYYRHYIKKK